MPDDKARNERNKDAMMKIIVEAVTDTLLLRSYRQDAFQIEILDGAIAAEVKGVLFDITVEVRS